MINIETPHTNDVLCGRGNAINDHNLHYRYLVQLYKKDYITCPRSEKGKYSILIVHAVRISDPPGRFLTKNPKTKLWYDIGDRKAVIKVKQALREGAPELKDEIKEDQKLERAAHLDESASSTPEPLGSVAHNFDSLTELKRKNDKGEKNSEKLTDMGSLLVNTQAKKRMKGMSIEQDTLSSHSHGSKIELSCEIWSNSTPFHKKPPKLQITERETSISLEDLSKIENVQNVNRGKSSNFDCFTDMDISLDKMMDAASNLTEIFKDSYSLSSTFVLDSRDPSSVSSTSRMEDAASNSDNYSTDRHHLHSVRIDYQKRDGLRETSLSGSNNNSLADFLRDDDLDFVARPPKRCCNERLSSSNLSKLMLESMYASSECSMISSFQPADFSFDANAISI